MALQEVDSRRSTAVQFFMDEDNDDINVSYRKVVEWLNQAALAPDNVKTDHLRRIQEIILHKEISLLESFLDEVLNFQTDRSADVRKFIVGFIEQACKKEPDVLPRIVTNLTILLQDSSVQVQKRVIQAASQIYRVALSWLAKARTVTPEMENAWTMIASIKAQIVNMIDSDNDGIRTHSVKFLETMVLLQTYPEAESMKRENDFSLEDVPLTLKIARRRKLEEEANMVFDLMVKFHGSPHVSSVNLMTCMGSLALIAKMRPQFMGKVVVALEVLHGNLPPTLTKSQVSSVRKHLKMQLLNLLKHPASVEFHSTITSLLTDLGATYQEVMKSYPKLEELRRRQKRVAESIPSSHSSIVSKKPRLDFEDEEEDDEEEDEGSQDSRYKKHSEMAVDITDQHIVERLSPKVVANLVMLSMKKLPDTLPSHFNSTYTPVAAAGTLQQKKRMVSLLAKHLTSAGLGPGAKQIKKTQTSVKPAAEDEDDEMSGSTKSSVSTAAGGVMDKDKDLRTKSSAMLQPTTTSLKTAKQRIKTLKLTEITKPLDKETDLRMLTAAVQRILKAERFATLGGVSSIRNKIITTLAATFHKEIRAVVLGFLLDDVRTQMELGFAWLYEEYSFMQGFNRMPAFLKHDQSPDERYNKLLCVLSRNLIEKSELKDRDALLARLYLEAPLITEDATELLKNMCGDEIRAPVGLRLLQDLVIRRPPRQLIFLNALLVHTAHENSEIRGRAIKCIVELYERRDLRSIIEEYAIFYLGFLRLPQPPDVLFGSDRGRPSKFEAWTEDVVKVCLYLYLALLPINEKLIHELARVYVQTLADVKRTILRLLEQPVRGMGMNSPQLLKLVEECPKGAETLVTRVIHVLTDKNPPSAELVARVRELYHTRVSDVRFLIPVLNGLTKKEVIAALPKLIKLNPVVVKEVFNRLLGTHAEGVGHTSPLTPAELLIALHNIDPSKCELKTVIKATSMCFAEKQAYTQEVLAVVMQHLMELNPLPTLLMRTVIQSLSLYPRLIGFVMNILQRLILKQVWKQKKVWEGFIKCCQRTKPQSFQVLLQLPPAQLSDVLINSPDLQQPLVAHVMAFTENQRAHIPQSIMDVLLGNRRPSTEEYDINMGNQSPSELTIDIKEEPEEMLVLHSEPAPPGMD